jgi:hypothetical protein
LKHACNSSRIRQPVCQHFSSPAPAFPWSIVAGVKLVGPRTPMKRSSLAAIVLCAAASPAFSIAAFAGSARDYLNAPVDAWMITYNAGYVTSVTPEDGTDITSRTVSKALLQSVVLTRTGLLGPCGRTLDYPALRHREYELQRLSGKHEWRVGCRIPVANKPFRRPCAHARTIPRLCPADILEFPSLHRNAARHL